MKISCFLKSEITSCIISVTLHTLYVCSVSWYMLVCLFCLCCSDKWCNWHTGKQQAPGGGLRRKKNSLRDIRKLLNEGIDLPKIVFLSSPVFGLGSFILTEDVSVYTEPVTRCLYFKFGVKYSTSMRFIHMMCWLSESKWLTDNWSIRQREIWSQQLSDVSLGFPLTFPA